MSDATGGGTLGAGGFPGMLRDIADMFDLCSHDGVYLVSAPDVVFFTGMTAEEVGTGLARLAEGIRKGPLTGLLDPAPLDLLGRAFGKIAATGGLSHGITPGKENEVQEDLRQWADTLESMTH